jgi:nucleotide sugar dehydrogenase
LVRKLSSTNEIQFYFGRVPEARSKAVTHPCVQKKMKAIKSVNSNIMEQVNQNKICIIGVGYVGEHLLAEFGKSFDVVGIDISQERIKTLRQRYKGVLLSNTFDNIDVNAYNVFLISVPTLLSNKKVDTSPLESVKQSLQGKLKKGSLIVIESSVTVGCTRKLFGEFHDQGIHVGFSPERIDPGRSFPMMQDIPKIVSGIDKESQQKIAKLYKCVFKNVVQVSSLECAEMCKLYENCFRMVNIAYVNEISDMCEAFGIDSKEMIAASSTKPFGFMPFTPGLGVGGHCIPVNPYYLMKDFHLPVLETSTKLMESRPKLKARGLLKKYPNAQNILVVGIAFKKGQNIVDHSPGFALYKELSTTKHVQVYDPLVQDFYQTKLEGVSFLSPKEFTLKCLNEFDLIIVNHASNEAFHILQKCKPKVLFTSD